MSVVYKYKEEQYSSISEICQRNNIVLPLFASDSLIHALGIETIAIPEPEPIEPTEEEKEKMRFENAKIRRSEAVALIKVEVDGMVLQGDEVSQGRMLRAIIGAEAQQAKVAEYKISWLLDNNEEALMTIEQLSRAQQIASQTQTAIWNTPYSKQRIEDVILPDGASIDYSKLTPELSFVKKNDPLVEENVPKDETLIGDKTNDETTAEEEVDKNV